jgi:hypothetical protein
VESQISSSFSASLLPITFVDHVKGCDSDPVKPILFVTEFILEIPLTVFDILSQAELKIFQTTVTGHVNQFHKVLYHESSSENQQEKIEFISSWFCSWIGGFTVHMIAHEASSVTYPHAIGLGGIICHEESTVGTHDHEPYTDHEPAIEHCHK